MFRIPNLALKSLVKYHKILFYLDAEDYLNETLRRTQEYLKFNNKNIDLSLKLFNPLIESASIEMSQENLHERRRDFINVSPSRFCPPS